MEWLVTFAGQHGPMAALVVLTLAGAWKLVERVQAANEAREERLQATSAAREERLVGVVEKQGAALESQSHALNRISERMDEHGRCLDRIEARMR